MKIGIDGYEANTSQRVGVGQYAYQLLVQLEKLDKKNEYTIFLPQIPRADLPVPSETWRYVVGKPGSFWTIKQLPFLIKKQPLDLFFSPTHYLPWFTQVPKVMSIMDVSYLHFPEMFRKKDLLQLRYMGRHSIQHAHKILTISEFSKKEIIKYYTYPEENIIVTYPGISSKLKVPIRQAQDRQSSKFSQGDKSWEKGRYILFVGTIQPRKNIVRLVEAFEKLQQKDVQLVLVGKKGWLYQLILERIEGSIKKSHIQWLDYVADADLPSLYQNARCFVLPSLYEGFGIPVVEAMIYGCPVVVSRRSSLPEVAGEAGIYVDPENSNDIADGISKALQLSKTERVALVHKGKEQAKKFTWENCAQKTIGAFESIKL